MSLLGYKKILSIGYEKYFGHAINKIIQETTRKTIQSSEEIPADVSNMFVEEMKSKPFEGLGLK